MEELDTDGRGTAVPVLKRVEHYEDVGGSRIWRSVFLTGWSGSSSGRYKLTGKRGRNSSRTFTALTELVWLQSQMAK